jgi:hypothetical protein
MQTQEYAAVLAQEIDEDDANGLIADERLASPTAILLMSTADNRVEASGGQVFN